MDEGDGPACGIAVDESTALRIPRTRSPSHHGDNAHADAVARHLGDLTQFRFRDGWADTAAHARLYTHRLGFGGPVLYVVDVPVDGADIYDLTKNPVGALGALGFDPYSQSPAEWLPGQIVRIGKLQAEGPDATRWWLFDVDEPRVGWLYLGSDPLPARPFER